MIRMAFYSPRELLFWVALINLPASMALAAIQTKSMF